MVEYKKIDELYTLIAESQAICTAMAASEPQEFFKYISTRPELFQTKTVLFCANPSQAYHCFTDPEFYNLNFIGMFLTSAVRRIAGERLQYYPHHLSQWAKGISSRGIDLFWGSCSQPDDRGFVSLGPSCCYESELIGKAKVVVLEVNPQIPVSHGSTMIPVSDVDYFIETDSSLPEVAPADISDQDLQIATHIADLVADGSTIQLGIGSIPNAIGEALKGKKDLGVHTEMINDTIMELYESGVVTGNYKTRWPRRIVGSFAYGSRKLYDFIDGNPMIQLHPASVVNDPYRIAKNHKMVSINTAVEVDITGQVCSESVGHLELSGIGGASETHVGAQRSSGGRGIIALHSKSKKGQAKIVSQLHPGAKVSISRNDIDTIVTEYGQLRLKGLTVRERALGLIQLASPDDRDRLHEEGVKFGYI